MKTLDLFKQMPPCPAEALISYLGELLPRMAGTQERYKVTEVPTIRTLRFYGSRGLLDKPLGYEGRTALYGYRHLLQAVVIKVLQANLLPLRKIREMLEGLSNEVLERVLEVPGKPGQAAESKLPVPLPHPPEEAPAKPDQGTGLTLSRLQELLNVRLEAFPALPEPGPVARQESHPVLATPPARATAWRRLEVEPGVELHLREDITVKPGSQLEVLATKIKYLLTREGTD